MGEGLLKQETGEAADTKKERMETKLYLPEAVDGKPNRRELKRLREVDEELSENPAFIGLAPFGSVVGGYGVESSDIDICVLFDAEKLNEGGGYLAFKYDYIDKIEAQNNGESHVSVAHLTSVPSEKMVLEDVRSFLDGKSVFPGLLLADMSRVFVGKKVDEYRKKVAHELQQLSPEDQARLVDLITENLVKTDGLSLGKRETRIPEITPDEHLEILAERGRMWRKRVQKIWGIGENK